MYLRLKVATNILSFTIITIYDNNHDVKYTLTKNHNEMNMISEKN